MIANLPEGGRADGVVVDVGPGSFTGIRVGVAAARALGFAWGVPVSGYCSLALIAAIDGNRDATDVVIEGGHGEVFVTLTGAAPQSLPFAVAVAQMSAPRLIGNAAARIVVARGWGEAVDIVPDARGTAGLQARQIDLAPRPLYLRGADAKPMA